MERSPETSQISLRAAEIAYGEARRAADRLSNSLDDFRTRAGTIFTIGVLATTFFGQAIGPHLHFLSMAAICLFVLGVAVPGVVIFLPIKKQLSFGLSAHGILAGTDPSLTEAEICKKAATSLLNTVEVTADRMEWMTVLLQVQCGALAAEMVIWTFDLAGR
jgi:hypothetical protein